MIRGMMRERIHSLELELAERGYDMDYINISGYATYGLIKVSVNFTVFCYNKSE